MSNNQEQFCHLSAKAAEELIKTGARVSIAVNTTREFVDWALTRNTHNRKLSVKIADYYASMMKEGKWFFTNNGIGFTKDGFLGDGQHRLEAIKRAGYPEIPLNVTFGLDKDAQMVIDRQKVRTAADGLELATGLSLTKSQGGTVAWLYTLEHDNDCVVAHIDPFEFRAIAEKYYDAIVKIMGTTARRGFSAAFFAPLVYLYAHGEDERTIQGFISGIETGEGLEKGDPRLKYRNEYLGLGRVSIKKDARISMFIGSAQMFMAYAEGKSMFAFCPYSQAKILALLRARAAALENA